jgi:hypothetical protein
VETTSRSRSVRRPAIVAVAGVLAVVALVFVTVGRGGGPPVIHLGADAAGTTEAAMDAASTQDLRMAYGVEYDFVLTDGARFGAGEATAWQLEPPADPEGALGALAARLGVEGEPTPTPYGDGSLFVGPQDGSGNALWFGPMGDWSFNGPVEPIVDCAAPTPRELDQLRDQEAADRAEAEDPAAEPGTEPDPGVEPEVQAELEPSIEPAPDVHLEEEGAGVEGWPGPEACEPPPPPAGVPDADEARRAAEAFFADLDLAVAPRITEVSADEWGAWVSATLPVAGQDTDVFFSVGFGAEGALTNAYGTLARPVEVGAYPTVDADTAVARLASQHSWSGGTVEPLVDLPAAEEDATVRDEGAPVQELDPDTVVDPVPDEGTVSILPAPGDPGEVEQITVTLVGVETRLVLVQDTEQRRWLLPGVRFTDTDGGVWEVLVVADEYLDTETTEEPAVPEPGIPEPEPGVPEPEPVDPDEPTEAPVPAPAPDEPPVEPDPSLAQAAAERSIGLEEADAVVFLEEQGLVARVVARDGEAFAVTDDYRTDRVNLEIADGIVTQAGVG